MGGVRRTGKTRLEPAQAALTRADVSSTVPVPLHLLFSNPGSSLLILIAHRTLLLVLEVWINFFVLKLSDLLWLKQFGLQDLCACAVWLLYAYYRAAFFLQKLHGSGKYLIPFSLRP